MLSSNQLKQITALQHKKYRQESGLYVVEGRKMVSELLKSDSEIVGIYAENSWADSFSDKRHKVAVTAVSSKELCRMSSLSTPDSVLAVVKQKMPSDFDAAKDLVLVLDSINNPGNLGTIIRLASWFGVKNIVCSSDTVDCYNPKTVQSTMGAVFHTNIVYAGIEEFLCKNKNLNIYGTVLNGGENIYTHSLSNDGIIIIGSESHGISKQAMAYVNNLVTVPSFSQTKDVESLNASIACAVVLSEFRRRRY
ncbi:MAG: RNA methyltransferase [Bacteroidales bacterium]|nr:RNA methyltransferase [Bacteroidales bacterium]